jgi:hypothetical protein
MARPILVAITLQKLPGFFRKNIRLTRAGESCQNSLSVGELARFACLPLGSPVEPRVERPGVLPKSGGCGEHGVFSRCY